MNPCSFKPFLRVPEAAARPRIFKALINICQFAGFSRRRWLKIRASLHSFRAFAACWLAVISFATSALAAPPAITNPPESQTIFLGDPATFRVTATGTTPLSYQWFRNSAAVAGATTTALSFFTSGSDANARFTVQVTNTSGAVTSPPAVLSIDFGLPGPAQTNRLIQITNVWRYHVGNLNLGTAWREMAYNDSAWSTGGGLLYVEDANLPAPKTSPLPLAPGSLPLTTYFRTRFTNQFASPWSMALVANTVLDDGVVLYLNGADAFRLRLPSGAIGFTNLAANVGDAVWEGPFNLPVTNLLVGTNLLAAEVHQSGASSSDIVMGLTLDAVWQPRLRDTSPPTLANLIPPPGATVTALTQIEIGFSEGVRGVDASDLLVNGVPATNLTALASNVYVFRFNPPAIGPVSLSWALNHGITDLSANQNSFAGTPFDFALISTATQLPFATVTQSTDASPTNAAAQALDSVSVTWSLTADQPGSWWQGQLARAFLVDRVEILNRPAPDDAALAGLTLRLYNLDDQVVYQTVLTNPGPGGLLRVWLPPANVARTLWIGLPGSQSNGAGNYRVGLAEVRLLGSAGLPYGPEPYSLPTNSAHVWQTSDYNSSYLAGNAVDGNSSTFSHTANLPNSAWMADLGQVYPIDRVEIVNRASCCSSRLANLVLRIFDAASNSIASAIVSDPGLGATWTNLPGGTMGRWIRIGLENNQTNGDGNSYVTIAEARVFSGTTNLLALSAPPPPVTNNLASFKPACMLRLDDNLAPASYANDDNYSTEAKTTLRTVDGYWEVDLGAVYALYGLRAIPASGIGYKLTNTVVRLYDHAHESIHSQRVTGAPQAFDVDLNGPRFARYVRIGLEDKTRTDPAGGIEFYIGFREVEVFGRPTNDVGIISFSASTNHIQSGQQVTLSWVVDDVRRVEIHPSIGSVGAYTAPNGIGSVTVPLTNSTEFILLATNAAGTFSRAVGVQVATNPLPVCLSELVAENKYSLKDGEGNAPDWIELRNTGNFPVDLTGCGLSDDPAAPMKWTFPATLLAPHATLIVFASGRESPFDPAGQLHAGFRLNKNGGTLLFTASNGLVTLDSVLHPELDTDLAYGRDLDGRWTFLEPTPAAVNSSTTWLGWLKPLDWSHPRGFYETNFTLTLTNNSPGASVLYSLDGSMPAVLLTNPLPVNGTVAVRAQAVRPGYKPARSQTKTFLFLNDVITSPVMNPAITQDPVYAARLRPGLLALPSISICVPGQPEYEEKEGSVEVLWPGGGDPVQINCGISRFGNAWTKYAKRSFRIKCRARYGEARFNVPLFNGFDRGVLAKSSFDELDLRSGSQDMSERGFYMAGRFVEDSMLDMGSLNPHGRFVHVYVNGLYWGQYDCRELLVEHFLADYLGGAAEDYVAVRGNDNVTDDFVIGAPEPPNLQPWEYTRSVRNSYAAVRPRLDVSHLVDFMLLWQYGNCESEFRSCGPINPGTGFKFWIADADGFLRTSALGLDRTDRKGPGGFFGALVAENNSDFKALLADRIYQHFFNTGALTPAANDARLAARMQEVRDSLIAECARWPYRTPASWESSAATIRSTLFPNRTSQLLGYLRNRGLYPAFDPPAFNQFGGLVTNGFHPVLSTTNGIIYYTLDGTDPRLPGGGISPAALPWSAAAVSITNDLTLSVRVRTVAGEWSALAQPRYLIASRRPPAARDLLVTEIHYNPPGSDDCEFIELFNAGTNLLDLSGVSLSNAVRFVFPPGATLAPGAFLLLVENRAAFTALFQTPASPYFFPDLNVAGEWAGALDNAGEHVSLVASNGLALSSIPYRPAGDWPERADGRGSSIEMALLPPASASDDDVRAFLASGRNWSSSSLYQGSPGRFDTFIKTVRFNEVLTHTDRGTDWLELFNTGNEPVNLLGFSLTDDMDYPALWTFATNTVLEPGEFLILSTDALGFSFSELGDNAYLLQVSSTNVIRFLDSVDFPAAERERSFGRFQRSDGQSDFTELRANTPGETNSLPFVGPVVISEIMLVPPPGKAQFLELVNITDTPVLLSDAARPTNVWKIDGVGPFIFPAGLVLNPCSTLIVSATNPAAFRAQYALEPAVPVFGPWTGRLDADGEALKLLSPGPPEPDGTVPFYRVDHVRFGIQTPWPATTQGNSLERIPIQAYGNDPSSWRSGPPGGTPGIPAGNRLPVVVVRPEVVVPQQTVLNLKVSVADLDAPWQTVSLAATHLPPGSSFDPSLGLFTWLPSTAQMPGLYTATFTASDTAACGPSQSVLEVPIEVAEPLLATAASLGGVLQITFPALPGETYRVESCTDLALADWQILQQFTPTWRQVLTFYDSDPHPLRFYRVVWTR